MHMFQVYDKSTGELVGISLSTAQVVYYFYFSWTFGFTTLSLRKPLMFYSVIILHFNK